MIEFFIDYGAFLAKAVTIVVAILFVVGGIAATAQKNRERGRERLQIKKVNDKFDDARDTLECEILDKKELKAVHKERKKAEKSKTESDKKRLFVLHFDGDIHASAVESLRDEISAVLTVAREQDEVLVLINSAGGVVNGYGLAASQLHRIRDANIKLTAAIDEVAASGGYMMACVADHVIAAPFAIVGSIGVVAQIPNFNRLLKRNHIDYEMVTAGEYKRTLTMFGENTDSAREKVKEDVDDTHELFKNFVQKYRTHVDLSKIATGDHWFGSRAKDLDLVDELMTSDDYLFNQCKVCDVFEVAKIAKPSLAEKLSGAVDATLVRLWSRVHREKTVGIG